MPLQPMFAETKFEVPMTIPKLLHDEKILIFKFLCVLAWADFVIHPNERKLIEQLARDFQVETDIFQMI